MGWEGGRGRGEQKGCEVEWRRLQPGVCARTRLTGSSPPWQAPAAPGSSGQHGRAGYNPSSGRGTTTADASAARGGRPLAAAEQGEPKAGTRRLAAEAAPASASKRPSRRGESPACNPPNMPPRVCAQLASASSGASLTQEQGENFPLSSNALPKWGRWRSALSGLSNGRCSLPPV